MKANIGTIDKSIRILLATTLIALYFLTDISGTAAIVLFIAAAVLLATSFISFCPIWHLLGISTKRKNINQ